MKVTIGPSTQTTTKLQIFSNKGFSDALGVDQKDSAFLLFTPFGAAPNLHLWTCFVLVPTRADKLLLFWYKNERMEKKACKMLATDMS
eukprot:6483755-Amphidinium_carterae.1